MAILASPNPTESSSFWRDALAWRGSITRRLTPRIALFTVYGGVVAYAHTALRWTGPDPIHLGYTGGFLALMLVFRTNATHDRWWEARKLWGGIVNQSRNLAIKVDAALGQAGHPDQSAALVRWTACFCHAARLHLRVPRVHTIKLRRLILLYLIAVPLALATSKVWVGATAMALISYPLLAIDQIAQELENPFSTERESHLPLDTICATIEKNVLGLLPQSATSTDDVTTSA